MTECQCFGLNQHDVFQCQAKIESKAKLNKSSLHDGEFDITMSFPESKMIGIDFSEFLLLCFQLGCRLD